MFLFRSPSPYGNKSPFGSMFLSAGVLSLAFGLAILIAPDLLAYLVATFFIVMGVSLLSTWFSGRN